MHSRFDLSRSKLWSLNSFYPARFNQTNQTPCRVPDPTQCIRVQLYIRLSTGKRYHDQWVSIWPKPTLNCSTSKMCKSTTKLTLYQKYKQKLERSSVYDRAVCCQGHASRPQFFILFFYFIVYCRFSYIKDDIRQVKYNYIWQIYSRLRFITIKFSMALIDRDNR